LNPEATDADLQAGAEICIAEKTASICVRPCDVKRAAALLAGSGVMVTSVLSFPHGADTTAVKTFAAGQAIESGASEIDMVMNIGRFLAGDNDYVRDDIAAVVGVAHNHGARVKVIQESCFLTLGQVATACEISCNAGADFVKTSTGFGPGATTPEIIDVMVRTVGNRMGVKASGGIRTWQDATRYLDQGVNRLGLSSTIAVLGGAE